MRFQNIIFCSVLVLICLVGVVKISLAAEDGNAHHEHHHAEALLLLDNGARWKTDGHLRKGMEDLRSLTEDFERKSEHADFTIQDAQVFKEGVDQAINYMVEHCQLSEDADSTLHVFLGDFIEGAELLVHESDSKKGFEKINHALHLYPDYFEHEGWGENIKVHHDDSH